MRIALDFDGTIADTNKLILDLMNWRLGTKYTMKDWNSLNFWQNMGPDAEKGFWGLFDLMDATYLRRALPPTDPFAPAVVKWMMKRGHEVHLVSMNKEAARPSFEGWLWAQGIEMPIVTRGRGSPKDKAELDYDIFIDDAPDLVEHMKEHPKKFLILFRRPLNDSVVGPGKILPENVWLANDWLEIKALLELMGI